MGSFHLPRRTVSCYHQRYVPSTRDNMKSDRKPRPRETGTLIGVRLHPPQLVALDAWISEQPEPRPGRPEVMRVALSDYLRDKGYLPAASEPMG